MQTRSATILIIGDEAECNEIATAIPRSLTGLKQRGQELILDIATEELVLHRSWEVDFATGSWDLCIFFLSSRDAHLFIANNMLLHDRTRAILVIAERQRQLPGNWRLRSHSDGVLHRPFTDNMLCARIEEILCQLHSRGRGDCQDEELVHFARRLCTEDSLGRLIEPMNQPQRHLGIDYPLVHEHFGINAQAIDILEHCANQGLLRKQLRNRIRLCPQCGSHELNHRELCPACHSIDFSRETIIRHFDCGHVDTLTAFQIEGRLVCPACRADVHHIGIDYDRPTSQQRCRACRHIFADPMIQSQCLHCGQACDPSETSERLVHAYEVLPYAEEVAESGHLHAIDLGQVLRAHDGLHTRQLFIFELEREIARFKRYQHPSAVVMIHIAGLDELVLRHGAELDHHLETLFQNLSGMLRSLDLTTLWEPHLLAVLLPGTELEGAWAVARRLEDRAVKMEFPITLDGLRLNCSAEAITESSLDAQQVIDNAMRVQSYIEDIAQNDFMPE